MESRNEEKKSRFQIEKLEERIAPGHLNPTGEPTVLPQAAVHGQHGVETAIAAPASHYRMIIVFPR